MLTGPLFSEPMQVETVRPNGSDVWIAGLVGQRSERFRRVTLTSDDISNLAIVDSTLTYDGDGRLLRIGLQAYLLGIAYEFDPYFGLSISRVNPLPHQLEAVYEHLVKLPTVRFLLADDAGVRSIQEAMERRRAPFYLRRTKEAMVYFPERQTDGAWVAKPVFTKRIPRTADFAIDGPEFELYQKITRFVKRQSARAAAEDDNPRARAVGFLMSLYQRRLASSTYAMRRSLENRAKRLEEGLAAPSGSILLTPNERRVAEDRPDCF